MNRHRLAQAGGEKKQAQDGGALPGPERVNQKILPPVAKVVQVKAEMEHRHPDHRKTAQRVNRVKSLVGIGLGLGAHGVKFTHLGARVQSGGCTISALIDSSD